MVRGLSGALNGSKLGMFTTLICSLWIYYSSSPTEEPCKTFWVHRKYLCKCLEMCFNNPTRAPRNNTEHNCRCTDRVRCWIIATMQKYNKTDRTRTVLRATHEVLVGDMVSTVTLFLVSSYLFNWRFYKHVHEKGRFV